ncbi:MAG: hypothetical protein IJV00_10515 [Clostridia bacterium]|nr:hypothetical protein [Clostridia bacterium]
MTLTSAQAAKLLKKLNEQLDAIIEKENISCSFRAAMGEDPESVRPVYDFESTQKEINKIEGEIRRLKHALNAFNVSHEIPGFGMTVDEMLVYLPQLSREKTKLASMRSKLPKTRVEDLHSKNVNFVDYTYLNYSVEDAEKAYEAVSEELSKAQLALDNFNNSATFEF